MQELVLGDINNTQFICRSIYQINSKTFQTHINTALLRYDVDKNSISLKNNQHYVLAFTLHFTEYYKLSVEHNAFIDCNLNISKKMCIFVNAYTSKLLVLDLSCQCTCIIFPVKMFHDVFLYMRNSICINYVKNINDFSRKGYPNLRCFKLLSSYNLRGIVR